MYTYNLLLSALITAGNFTETMEPESQRHRYVFGLIGAPCDSNSKIFIPNENATNKVVPRVSLKDLNPNSRFKSSEERAADYLAGVGHDIDTMREFFGRGQDIRRLFCYNHVDAQGKQWLLKKLRDAFAAQDVRAFFVYYSGHGRNGDGAWYLGDRGLSQETLPPGELFQLWQESLSGKSGDSVLIIISDSCHSGYWVEAAKKAQLSSVAVQSATDQDNPSFDDEDIGGIFTYKVYRRGRHFFQSIFSVTGILAAVYHAVWIVYKETLALVLPRDKLYPQTYVPDQFQQIMTRRGGTIQPHKVINNGRFLFVDTTEWIMFC